MIPTAVHISLKTLLNQLLESTAIIETMTNKRKTFSMKSFVKCSGAEATNSFSSAGTSCTTNYKSTAVSAFTRTPTSNSSVVGVAIRSGYTLIITIL